MRKTAEQVIRECVLMGPVTDEERSRADVRRRARELPNLSWRAIANALGNRMANHAQCVDHPTAESSDPDCPFCRDRSAYQLYRIKLEQLGQSGT